MNKINVLFLIIIMIASAFLIYEIDSHTYSENFNIDNETYFSTMKYNTNTILTIYNNTTSRNYTQYNSTWIHMDNWNAFWFNDSRCNETNTESYYENKKIDGQWQMTEVLTCLNMTVRIIPQ